MLSIDNVSLSKGRSYYEKENYYSKESAKEHSQWHGKLAEDMGLKGNVDFNTFDNLLFGMDPNGKSIATNSVNPALYREPEISKKERGNLEFTVAKICEKLPFTEIEYKKIHEIIKYQIRHNKKITVGVKKTCLASINRVVKGSKLTPLQREEAKRALEAAISNVTRPKERRAGYDLTFSAPKSVSIMGLVGKDNEIINAHREAVLDVLNYIEARYANTRIGDNVKREIENTKKLLIAQFEHNTSRENDPQLHTHNVVLNLIQRSDGEWRSLHADDFRNHSKLFGTIYQNQLAKRVYELGYDISPDKDSTFKITQVPIELCETFSKRRKQLIEQGVTDQKSARDIVYIDRAKKPQNISEIEQSKKWMKETNEIGADLSKIRGEARKSQEYDKAHIIEIIHDSFAEASKMKMAFKLEESLQLFAKYSQGKFDLLKVSEMFDEEAKNKLIKLSNGMFITKQALEMEQKTIQNLEKQQTVKSILSIDSSAIDQLIKEKSSFSLEKKNALIQEVIEKTLNLNPEAKLHILEIMQNFIYENRRLTFEENENIKSFISEVIKELKITKSEKKELKANLNFLTDKATELTEGQKEAIKQTLLTTDKHIAWLGVAGAGKTFSLATVVEQAKRAGYDVAGFAQNKKAADVLSQETKIKVNTIASLLLKEPLTTQKEKIWIIDEAGMIGTKLGHDFVERAQKENARLIIVGDNRQLSSPTAGHFLKLVTNYTNIKKVELNKSLRQKDENLAKGVEVLNFMLFDKLANQTYKRTGKSLIDEALGYFKNSIHEFKTEEGRVSALVKDFLSTKQAEREKTLIVAKTHKVISEITSQIRESLKNEGYLKNEISAFTFTAVDLSESKGKYASNYEVGNLIVFDSDNNILSDNKKFTFVKNEEYKITKTDLINNIVTIENKEGNLFSFNPSKFKYEKPPKSNEFSLLPVYKKSEIKICENDKLSWSKNVWQTNRVNKKEFKVLKIDKSKSIMNIIYNNGRMENIDLNAMNFIQHNWAVTYNAAQGDTKKNVLGIIDGISSIEDIYTVFTRPTHNLKVYVESEKKLKSSMERSGSKKTAMEIVNEKKEEYLITKSNKMDFYDKYQRVVSIDKNKVILSLSAPSDISSMLFSHENDKEKILAAHNNAIKQSLEQFNQITGKNFEYITTTKEALFEKTELNLSKIPYLNTNVEVIGIKDNLDKPLNNYTFMEHQGILKNLYQNNLAQNLNSLEINCFNENGILRVSERNDHIHAIFSEEFEKNIKRLVTQFKENKFDKFCSPYEIEKYANMFEGKSEKQLDWSKISTQNVNETQKVYQKQGHKDIIKNTIHTICKYLQVFSEIKIYESLLNETKGNIPIHEINDLHAQLLVHPDLKMIDYDRFGKMIFAHKDLNDDEAKILSHSTTRTHEKNFILSFERVLRRAENKNFSQEQIAALAHCTLDNGNVKFLSGLSDKEAKSVFNETASLYKNSGFKVMNVYAGRQAHTKTILNTDKDFHIGYLLNKIHEKKVILDDKTVIILKDIGDNITQNASNLFDLAKEKGAKIVFHANEIDFKEGEKKTYLKSLKNISGINLKQRYVGLLKQKSFYDKQESNKKALTRKNNKFALYLNKDEMKKITNEEKNRLNAIMADVKNHYTNNLFKNEGKEALEYLHKRGYTNEQIKELGFGLSFTKGLEAFAIEKGYSQNDMVSLSLMTQKDDGERYDFYRNRIMIPIHDSEGNCIGFGGRIYRNYEIQKKVSKYINPRKTILFDKKSTLFGLDRAMEEIKKEQKVYVVEGYMDAIAMQNAGIKNVVAVMGTSLTKENIDQLSGITKEVVLLFDNDKAGINASKLSYLQAVNSNLKLSHTSISKEKDPDEYIKKFGAEDFKSEIEKNTVPLDYFVNNLYKNVNNEVGITEIRLWRQEVFPSILKIEDPIYRNLELKGASISLNTPITQLLDEKHYKYVPEAFLNEDEVQNRREYFNRIHKKNSEKEIFKAFDNTANSKTSTQKIFQEAQLKNAIEFEMKKLNLDFHNKNIVKKFKEEHKIIIQNLKELIEYNELVIAEKIGTHNEHKEKVNPLNIYKHINGNFMDQAPQEISEILFKEQQEKQKDILLKNEELSAFLQKDRLLSEINNGSIKEEVDLIKEQYKNSQILEYLSFKFATLQIDRLNELSIDNHGDKENFLKFNVNIEKFKDFLQNHRLEPAKDYQAELKFQFQKDFQNEFEKQPDLYIKYNYLDFKEKELLIEKIFPNQINKDLNLNENMKLIENGFYKIADEKEANLKKFENYLSDFIAKKESLRIAKTNEIAKNSLEKAKEHSQIKENLKAFENSIKNEIYSKIQNKNNIEEVFFETRKILVKESKFISKEEKNPEKAYFNLAKSEHFGKFKDIIYDINLSKIDRKIEEKNSIENPNILNSNKFNSLKPNEVYNNIHKANKMDLNNESERDSYISKIAQKAGISLDKISQSYEKIDDKLEQFRDKLTLDLSERDSYINLIADKAGISLWDNSKQNFHSYESEKFTNKFKINLEFNKLFNNNSMSINNESNAKNEKSTNKSKDKSKSQSQSRTL